MRSPAGHRRTALIAHPGAELYGSDRVMLESVSALVESGWRVVVTTPVPGPLLDEVHARGAETVVLAAPVLRKSALSPAGLVRLGAEAAAGLVRGLRLLRRIRPELLYVSTLTLPTWPVLGRAARLRVLVHVHEAERGARPLVRRALALPLLAAHAVLVNSRFSLDTLALALPALAEKSTVVYNGVPGPPVVTSPRASIDVLRVLYLGRISPRKGVAVAVEALAELRRMGVPATLDLVGAVFPGYEWFEAELRERITDLGLDDEVRLAGFSTEVWTALAAADIVVVPSVVDEPFGNTAVEAVLAARPVIVSRSGGLPEAVAGFAGARVVEPGDSGALASALRDAAGTWNSLRARVARDAEEAADRYSPAGYRRRIADTAERPARRRTGRQETTAARPPASTAVT